MNAPMTRAEYRYLEFDVEPSGNAVLGLLVGLALSVWLWVALAAGVFLVVLALTS